MVLFLGLALASLLEYYDWGGSEKRVSSTRVFLEITKSRIKEYKEKRGEWPVSLSELAVFSKENSNDKAIFPLYGEVISSRKGNSLEKEILDGSGGWYYNKSTGDVKINLTKPVRIYLKLYFGQYRNNIPSDW